MSKPTIQFIFKENPDGSRTAIDSQNFFNCSSEETKSWNTPEKERFFEERVAIENDKIRYLCGGCLKPVVIRGGGPDGYFKMHFRHRNKISDECPFEDSPILCEKEINKLKYKGAQESPLHENLKLFISNTLEKSGYDVEIEKTINITGDKRRRPDVLGHDLLNDRYIVFEIQLSTTYLHVINDRMKDYKSIGYYVIWIFDEFAPHLFTTQDTSQFHNNNIFVLDDEMRKLSEERGNLHLKCYYLKYKDTGKSIPMSYREEKIVILSDLIFNSEKGVYFFDSKGNRKEIETVITKRKNSEKGNSFTIKKLQNIEPLENEDVKRIIQLFESSEDYKELINEIFEEGLEQMITPSNIFVYFQWLELLLDLKYLKKYEILKMKLRDSLIYDKEFNSTFIWGWCYFDILNHPDIIKDKQFLYSIYHLGFEPDFHQRKLIEIKAKETLLAITPGANDISGKACQALNNCYLMKIINYGSTAKEKQELIKYYWDNFSFVACVIAITTERFIEFKFSNIVSYCNFVQDHLPHFCKTYMSIIDKLPPEIIRPKLVSKKGVDHYLKLKMKSKDQEVPPIMDKILSIIIPKVWNK